MLREKIMHKYSATILKQALNPLTHSFKPRHVRRSVVLPKLKKQLDVHSFKRREVVWKRLLQLGSDMIFGIRITQVSLEIRQVLIKPNNCYSQTNCLALFKMADTRKFPKIN